MAERMPQEHLNEFREPSLLAQPLMWLTGWVLRRPVPILALAVCAAVFSLVLASGNLGFHTSRIDLINPNNDQNKLYVEFVEEFGEENEVVIVVEGESRDEVVAVLDDLSQRLAEHQGIFRAVLHELDLSRIRAKGLHYATPSELHEIEDFVIKTKPIVDGQWDRLATHNMLSGMQYRLSGQANIRAADYEATVNELDRLSVSLLNALGPEGTYRSPWPSTPQAAWPAMSGLVATVSDLDSPYLVSGDGTTGFIFLQLANPDKSQFAQGTQAIETLRALVQDSRDARPHVKVGLTGLPIMENDEMQQSQEAMTKASILSLFGVACLFIAGLGGLRHPLMTVGALLLALAWSFGYITLAIGHLNILSISFGVVLIGLGIDFGIHYVARYLQLRGKVRGCEESIVRTAGSVGPGILTGAITTSIAFFAAGLTEFTGVAELGVIAGGGIILCCAAAIFLLPAMLQLSDSRRIMRTMPQPLDVHGALLPLFRRPAALLAVTMAGTLLITLGMGRLWYDHNLLNLQQEGLESVELERKLLDEYAQSVSYAVSITDSREELLKRREKLEALPSVSGASEIASVVPPVEPGKRPVILRIGERLNSLPERPGTIPVAMPADLGRQLGQAADMLQHDPRSAEVRRRIETVRRRLRTLYEPECRKRLELYQAEMCGDLLNRLHELRSMADPTPPALSDLPEGLRTRFVSDNGNYLLKIHPAGNIWDMDELERFVTDVRSVDPNVTGNPIQTYVASKSMQQSYQWAAVYALIAIVVVLMIDFRSIGYTLLAMVPLGLGMLQMFGLLGLLGIPLNPANMIVLPLILGIGIDDGVHVVHDFRNQKGRYHMSPSTASAVLITSLTTMIGFGSLMIADHRGLQSLGRVLTIGVTCCLFTSLIMLPAILSLMTRHRAEEEADEAHAHEPGHRRDWRRLHERHETPPGFPHDEHASERPTPAREDSHRDRR